MLQFFYDINGQRQTKADFIRLEQGQPPMNCTCPVANTMNTTIIHDKRGTDGSKKIAYSVEVKMSEYKKMTQNEKQEYAITLANKIYYKSGKEVFLSDPQWYDFHQEAKLHWVAYSSLPFSFVRKSCEVIDIDIYEDGTVYDDRWIVNLFREFVL